VKTFFVKLNKTYLFSDQQWLERRFLASDRLGLVFDYLASEGFPIKEFKVLSSWPRRDVSIRQKEHLNFTAQINVLYSILILQITTLNPDRNLEEVKLVPQETLTLEEK